MADVLLNGREPVDWELPALEHGRQCERDRDLALLAGILAGDQPPARVPRPVTEVMWEFGQ
jgi:hypothetical protein